MSSGKPTLRDLAYEWAARTIRRPLANTITKLVVFGGLLVIAGPPIATGIASKLASKYLDVQIDVSDPDIGDYLVGCLLVMSGLVYSATIHWLDLRRPRADDRPIPELKLLICEADGSVREDAIEFKGDRISMRDGIQLPDYAPARDMILDSVHFPNRSYYREMFIYKKFRLSGRQLHFCIENTGTVSAKNLRLRIRFGTGEQFEVQHDLDAPEKPFARIDRFRLPSKVGRSAKDVEVAFGDVVVDLAVLNPGDHYVTSDPVWLVFETDADTHVPYTISAEELSVPASGSIAVRAELRNMPVSLDELRRIDAGS